MSTEFRLCDEDRERFEGPEWVLFDVDALDDVPFDRLRAWEKQVKMVGVTSLAKLLGEEFAEFTIIGITGVVWLARQMAGLKEPALKDFTIKTRKVTARPVTQDGDEDPPAEDSSPTSSEAEQSLTV